MADTFVEGEVVGFRGQDYSIPVDQVEFVYVVTKVRDEDGPYLLTYDLCHPVDGHIGNNWPDMLVKKP